MKAKFFYIICFLVVSVLGINVLYAQQVQVNARIDSTSILIGDPAHIHLTAAYDVKNGLPKIQWPQVGDSIGSKIEVIGKSKIDTIIPDSSQPTIQQQTEEITITGYDSGYYAIPPFRFLLYGDTSHPLLTDAMMLQINTLQIDTTKAFKDIKAPIQAPFSLLEILPYAGYGLLALLIIGGLIYLIVRSLKNKKPVIIEKPKVVIPPHVKALDELEKLGLKKLWQEGKIKDYYTGITDILRIYIEERYDIGTLEMTTDEIMLALKRKNISEGMKEKLGEILVLADLVKFAKENPLPNEHEYCLNASIDFVNATAEKKEANSMETPSPGEANPIQQNPLAT